MATEPATALAPAVALCLFAAGCFLLAGMGLGLVKWRAMLASATHLAPPYIDIAHRAALMYSFAALVMAELLRYSPYPDSVQLAAAAGPLLFFAIAVGQYTQLGWRNATDNQFAARRWTTTWGTAVLAAVEIGGVAVILAGFVQTQLTFMVQETPPRTMKLSLFQTPAPFRPPHGGFLDRLAALDITRHPSVCFTLIG